MRDGKIALRALFRIITLCGSFLAAARYGVFWVAVATAVSAVILGCLWYLAMRRAPGPTLHLTIAFLLLTPLFAVVAASLQHSREYGRRQQAIESLRGVSLEMQTMMRAHPELERASNEKLGALAGELIRQRAALGLRGERQGD